MNGGRLSKGLLLSLLAAYFSSTTVFGWGPLAHYTIAREAAGEEAAAHSNLPDSWEQWTIRQGVSEWFAWSHGVLKTGRGRDFFPLTPDYSLENPGDVMRRVCMTAMNCDSDARNTVLGFLAHNIEDREAHWDFFPGGSIELWGEHEDKELWADCWVYTEVLNGLFDNNTGKALGLPQVSNRGDATLIRSAQQIFNDPNGTSSISHTGPRVVLSQVQTVSQISRQIADYDARLRGELGYVNLNVCQVAATNVNASRWRKDDMKKRFDSAREKVRNLYQNP